MKFHHVILIFIAVFLLILAGADLFDRELMGSRTFTPTSPVLPSQDFLSFDSGAERHQWEERQMQKMNSYGWVDRRKKIVHVPIESAMSLWTRSHGEANGDRRD